MGGEYDKFCPLLCYGGSVEERVELEELSTGHYSHLHVKASHGEGQCAQCQFTVSLHFLDRSGRSTFSTYSDHDACCVLSGSGMRKHRVELASVSAW